MSSIGFHFFYLMRILSCDFMADEKLRTNGQKTNNACCHLCCQTMWLYSLPLSSISRIVDWDGTGFQFVRALRFKNTPRSRSDSENLPPHNMAELASMKKLGAWCDKIDEMRDFAPVEYWEVDPVEPEIGRVYVPVIYLSLTCAAKKRAAGHKPQWNLHSLHDVGRHCPFSPFSEATKKHWRE